MSAPSAPDVMKAHKEARDRLALSIGQFSIQFATLERAADHAIWVLLNLGNSKLGELLTGAILNVSTRLDILSSLAHGLKMDATIRDEINQCVLEMAGLNAYRNWLLHGAWAAWEAHNDQWQKRRTRTERKFRTQWKKFSTAEIDERAAECYPLTARLSKAVKSYERWRNAQPT